MSSFSKINKRTKWLLGVLAVVVAVSIYFNFLKNDQPAPVAPIATKSSQETGSTAPKDGQPESPQSDLPADPTKDQRPGKSEPSQTQLPAKLPGTQQVVILYNPFRLPDVPTVETPAADIPTVEAPA